MSISYNISIVKMEQCTVSRFLPQNDECHKITYSSKAALIKCAELSIEDRELLSSRIGDGTNRIKSEDTLCLHHEKVYLSKYEHLQRSCCDPLQLHKDKSKTKQLRAINDNVLLAIKQHRPKKSVCKGQKLCPTCRITVLAPPPEESADQPDEQYEEEYTSPELDISAVSEACTSLGISPLKQHSSTSYGKRKLSQIQTSAASKIAGSLDIPMETILEEKSECKKCYELIEISEKIKMQIKNAKTTQEKVSLTMLAPSSWTKAQIKATFGVSDRIIKYARAALKEDKVTAEPKQKKGKTLDENTLQNVKSFYEDDEVSRICPGIQDYVSVRIDGVKVQKQKRLLLSNLREVFAMFKARYPDCTIGFSKFCQLRPAWVVTTSASGMHNVCVCQIHQNLKLMIDGLPSPLNKMDYTELFDLIVCDKTNRDCMIHRCENCPGQEGVTKFISEKLEAFGLEEDDIIHYKQWTHTDRTELITVSQQVSDFIETLSKKVDTVTTHHFIAKKQAAYLRRAKDNLKEDEMIVLLDFAQNYSFLVQDSIQGHHWNNSMATVHPYCLYFLKDGKLTTESLCIISDCLEHNVYTVYKFNSELIGHIKANHPHIKKVMYWSDGAASQYKNYKNLSNLANHFNDYGIHAEWHFFATSHGKSPCDGIGGTVKRLAASHSLKATSDSHILTPMDLFNWSTRNVPGIKFLYVTKDSVDQIKPEQDMRYGRNKTIPGTRSNHVFVPTPDGSLTLGRISQDIPSGLGTVISNFGETQHQTVIPLPGQYIAAVYDRKWYIGNSIEISTENRDVRVDFMTRSGTVTKPNLRWPAKGKRDDKCWVPFENILCVINAPSVASSSGRLYKLDEQDLTKINSLFAQYKKDHF